ncbi:YlxR family protein [bacterium]|nr:YlxR family protein [bacterium]
MTDRKCIGCGQVKNRDELIKITKEHATNSLVINGNAHTFGRSAYLCYNNTCIENAFKKNKLQKILKTPIPQELKGNLINEL